MSDLESTRSRMQDLAVILRNYLYTPHYCVPAGSSIRQRRYVDPNGPSVVLADESILDVAARLARPDLTGDTLPATAEVDRIRNLVRASWRVCPLFL